MSRIEELRQRYKILYILLWILPFTFSGIVYVITKTSKRVKLLIVLGLIIFGCVYVYVVHEFIDTKRELFKLQGIELTIEPIKEQGN